MKVIIAGSRDVTATPEHLSALMAEAFPGATMIVSGMAMGIDTSAIQYAREFKIPYYVFPAEWNKHGKAAGPIRNREMAKFADALLAIWDGKSRGTKNMIEEMEKLGKPAFIQRTDW